MSCPFEGGHPDHDVLRFCLAASGLRKHRAGALFEYASYNRSGWQVFVEPQPSDIDVVMTDEEQMFKTQIGEVFASQQEDVLRFSKVLERFRSSRSHPEDLRGYLRPHHNPYYETFAYPQAVGTRSDGRIPRVSPVMTSIAVVLRVGRPTARRVVKELTDNLLRYGHFSRLSACRLYLSIDEANSNTPSCESIVDAESRRLFSAVRLIRDKDRREIAGRLTRLGGVSADIAEAIALRRPYSDQLNGALMCAMADDNDAAVFFDDDVSLMVPVRASDGQITWRSTDVFGWHLKAIESGATVTTGRVVGFLSPIQPALAKRLSADLIHSLGNVFADAHEFLASKSFGAPAWRTLTVAEADKDYIRPLNQSNGYRWITPANLGIDLRRDFPLFFNPPGARGEDAFFSMALLSSAKVAGVPSTVFHDPFLSLPGDDRERRIDDLTNPPLTSASLDRFVAAMFGWVAYMPLFLKISRGIEGPELAEELERRGRLIRLASEGLMEELGVQRCKELRAHYQVYCDRVNDDFASWTHANEVWRSVVIPHLVTGM